MSEKNRPGRAYSWYVVVLLMTFYVLSFLDRQIIAILVEPIKRDLSLSDVQVSLVGGLSFVIFYATAGVFVGRLADRMNRPLLIGVGILVWSAATALCGLAAKFWHLLVLRMGVGLGEATLLPSSISLIADYFPRHKVSTPTSVFMLGAPIGIGIAYAGGGYLYGLAVRLVDTPSWNSLPLIGGLAAWQLVLLFIGLGGVLMSALMFTVTEPRETGSQATKDRNQGSSESFESVKAYFIQHYKAIGGLFFGMSFISLASYSQGFWDITFLTRTYEWRAEAGSVWYGAVQLIGGITGMLTGGFMSDRLARNGVAGSSAAMALVGAGLALPASITYPLMPTPNLSLGVMFFAIFGNSMAFAATASALQKLFPIGMLGIAAGTYFFVSNAVGIGAGPTSVALITDYVYEDPGMVRNSLAIVGSVSRLLAFVLIFLSFRHLQALSRSLK